MISVVITCYNLEQYIGAAIKSVLAQDIDEPVEIIVVDDCSTDGSAAIIRSFPDICFKQTASNSGVLLAMLEGIAASSGDLIFFLDGDDIWEPEKLAACIARFNSDAACALVTHDLSFIDGTGRPLDRQSRPSAVLTRLGPEDRPAKVRAGILLHEDYVWLGSALGVRKSLARSADFMAWAKALPDPVNTYQDWPLAFWIAAIPGNHCSYVPRKLFRYRLHGSNHSGDARDAGRAVRNLRRARNTLHAMLQIASIRALPADVVSSLQRRTRSYEYLIELYSGRRSAALAGFIRAVPDFVHRGEAGKELVRLVAIFLMGAARFTRLASMRRPN